MEKETHWPEVPSLPHQTHSNPHPFVRNAGAAAATPFYPSPSLRNAGAAASHQQLGDAAANPFYCSPLCAYCRSCSLTPAAGRCSSQPILLLTPLCVLQELQPLVAHKLEVAAATAAAAAAARSTPAHAQMSSSQILSALTNNIIYKQVDDSAAFYSQQL